MAARTTLADVATHAGVSVSTASLAFSGAGPVSSATRERVLAAAALLGYVGPDPRGRSLRSGRSGIVGVVLEDRVLEAFRDPIMIAFLDGIAAEVSPGGRALLLLADVGESPHVLSTAPMDAVVLVSCSPATAASAETVIRRGMPIVVLGGSVPAELDDVPSVTLDDRAATATSARHLHALGHRHIAVVALPTDIDRRPGPLTDERIARCTTAVTTERLLGARDVFPTFAGEIATGSYVEEGVRTGHLLLADPSRRPTAIIAQSDLLAAGVIKAATELGLDVPGDLSVVGFDGVRVDHVIDHDLTTLRQPAAEEGRTAGRLVLDQLAGREVESVGFTCEFHLGGTTGPPR